MTMQVEAIVREGAVIIPPAIKESLHLHDGDTLVFDADQDQGTVRLSEDATIRCALLSMPSIKRHARRTQAILT